jgi:hypothetical protein
MESAARGGHWECYLRLLNQFYRLMARDTPPLFHSRSNSSLNSPATTTHQTMLSYLLPTKREFYQQKEHEIAGKQWVEDHAHYLYPIYYGSVECWWILLASCPSIHHHYRQFVPSFAHTEGTMNDHYCTAGEWTFIVMRSWLKEESLKKIVEYCMQQYEEHCVGKERRKELEQVQLFRSHFGI